MSEYDIVERLRAWTNSVFDDEAYEAADTIERLTLERDYWERARNEWEKSCSIMEAENRSLQKKVEMLREALKVCAIDLEAEVRNRYMNGGDVHPALRWRYERDMAPVVDARAALDETKKGDE